MNDAAEPEGQGDLDSDRLRELVLFAKVDELAEELGPLSELQRRFLSKGAWDLHRSIEMGTVEAPEEASLWRRSVEGLLGPPPSVFAVARMAVLGLCPQGRWRRIRFDFLDREAEKALIKILQDRGVPWLGSWLEEVRMPAGTALHLVRATSCGRPSSAEWVLAVTEEKIVWNPKPDTLPLARRLLSEPDLLEHEAWRLFEIETRAFLWYPKEIAGANKKTVQIDGWGPALIWLAEQGHLDRQRLLDASLDGLASPLGAPALSALRRFHAELEPSVEEISSRQASYGLLLGVGVGSVAGLGLKMLSRLHRAKTLDVGGFLRSIGPLFELPAKTQPLAGLRFLKKIAAAGAIEALDERARRDIAEAVARGLFHPQVDVQEATLEWLLGSVEAEIGAPLVEGLLPSLDGALPKNLAERLADGFGFELSLEFHGLGPEADSATELAELEEELVGRLVGLGSSSYPELGERGGDAATVLRSLPPPWRFEFGQDRLRSLERIEPIQDWRELLDAAAHAVEHVDSADEIERLLDGLARLGSEKPPEFVRSSEALRERLRVKDFQSGSGLANAWGGIRLRLREVVETWVSDHKVWTWNPFQRSKLGPYPFISQRLEEICRRLLTRRRDPLLAAPTHRGGWIEAAVLIERLRVTAALRPGGEPDPADFMQALLRLAPDGRAEALEKAAELRGRIGALVRFALGGPGPVVSDVGSMMSWLAAARSRSPRDPAYSSLSALGEMTLTMAGAGPDGVEEARYRWRSETWRVKRWGKVRTRPDIRLWTDWHRLPSVGEGYAPAQEKTTGGESRWRYWLRRVRRFLTRFEELPTTSLHRLGDPAWPSLDQQTEWQVEMAKQVWPAQTDAVLVAGVRWVTRLLDSSGSNASPDHAYLSPLFDVDCPWSEVAYLAAAVASLSLDLSVKGAAIDALIEAIEDGRCHPEALGETYVELWRGGWPKPNRLASALEEIARVSPWHELVMVLVLDRLVASWRELPHGAHHLLPGLHGGMTAHGLRPREATQALLGKVKTGGKTGKWTRALLALEGTCSADLALDSIESETSTSETAEDRIVHHATTHRRAALLSAWRAWADKIEKTSSGGHT